MKNEPTSWNGATKVYSRGGKQAGTIISASRQCNLEGCRGLRLGVRWKDGKVTFPCTKGLKERKDGQLQIE